MRVIDPHIHMLSRTTDDYSLMAEAGIVAVCEPAFWPGTDRQYPESHLDYFNHMTTFEPRRAAKRGIKHYCVLCVNPKESENVELTEKVLERIDPYLARPTVLGIGEIGLNKNTENEIRMFRRQLEMAIERRHCTRETIDIARETGCWTGLTVYPGKLTPEDAAGIVRDYGTEHMLLNSSADWEDSDPLAVLVTVGVMRQMGLPDSLIEALVFANPSAFLGQSPKFQV